MPAQAQFFEFDTEIMAHGEHSRLCRFAGTRLPRSRRTDRRCQIPDMVSIRVRPPEIKDRMMPSHREGDVIKGAGNKSSVGCLWNVPAAWCCLRIPAPAKHQRSAAPLLTKGADLSI